MQRESVPGGCWLSCKVSTLLWFHLPASVEGTHSRKRREPCQVGPDTHFPSVPENTFFIISLNSYKLLGSTPLCSNQFHGSITCSFVLFLPTDSNLFCPLLLTLPLIPFTVPFTTYLWLPLPWTCLSKVTHELVRRGTAPHHSSSFMSVLLCCSIPPR